MADQQSGHAGISPAIKTYYTKRILKDWEKETSFYAAAPVKEDLPMGTGKTIEFTRYKKIPALYKDDTDEFTAQQLYLSAEIVSATLHERDGYVQLSRTTTLTSINRAMDRAADKIKGAAQRTLDILVRNDIGIIVADVAAASSVNFNNMAIDGGTLNSTGITARIWTNTTYGGASSSDRFPVYHNKTRIAQSALVSSIAKTALTPKTIQNAVSVLEGKDVPVLGDGNYRLITHTYPAYQITTSSGFKGWFSPTTSDPVKKRPSEVGIIAGTTVERTNIAYKFPLSGDTLSTGSGHLFASLLFGDEAYGVSQIAGHQDRSGFNFFLKQSGDQTTSDPTNKKKQAAFSVYGVAKVLNKSAGMWILSTEKV